MNSICISGNLTRDPELRATAGGTSVLTFSVAVNERRQNKSGEWEDYANYVDCTMFGKRAESLSRILAKGTKVAVQGSLRYSSWERDGQKRSKLEVIASDIDVMQKAKTEAKQEQSQQQEDVYGFEYEFECPF